jgi:predicted dehydrogenase
MAKVDNAIRVGVIGPGGAGRGNTFGMASLPGVEIVAASDINERSLDALEKGLSERVQGYQAGSCKKYIGEYEYIMMIDKEDLDIVGVFSPHTLHDIHVKYALRNNMSVIVEKPMACVVGDAILMHKIAMSRGLHLVGGYQRHYSDVYVTAKDIVRSGKIGELKKFEVYLAQRWHGGGWRGDPKFSGGGQPNDSGSHIQDIFMWITGLLPKTVYGTTSNKFEHDDGRIEERPIEIDCDTEVTMENGAVGIIKIVGNTRVGFEEWIIFEGDEATLEIKGGMRLIPKGGEPQEVPRKIPEGYPKSKVDQIVGLVKGDYSVNYTSGINGIRTSWLTNAIIQSGKGPEEKNTVDCDELIENEGFSRQFVKDLIVESERKNML